VRKVLIIVLNLCYIGILYEQKWIENRRKLKSTTSVYPKQKKMDMKSGTWNVRSTYRAGSHKAMAEEISKYKLDLVGVQEVRWGGGGTETAGEYKFFY
jgi:hypothetical protein